VHGGFTATLLDTCMGLAVQSTLDTGFGQTTVEFKVSLIRADYPANRPHHGGRRRAEQWPSHRHRRRTRYRYRRAPARARNGNVFDFSELTLPR